MTTMTSISSDLTPVPCWSKTHTVHTVSMPIVTLALIFPGCCDAVPQHVAETRRDHVEHASSPPRLTGYTIHTEHRTCQMCPHHPHPLVLAPSAVSGRSVRRDARIMANQWFDVLARGLRGEGGWGGESCFLSFSE